MTKCYFKSASINSRLMAAPAFKPLPAASTTWSWQMQCYLTTSAASNWYIKLSTLLSLSWNIPVKVT